MTGRIITVRHGKPDLSRAVKITAREYGDWWQRYDESGLQPDERPTQLLIDLGASMKTVVSSSLPRAIETAQLITQGKREIPADPVFVEAPLPPPPVPLIKLRPGSWGVISRSFWFSGYAPGNVESHFDTWGRVREVTKRLAAYAQDGDVMLCAHGYLNWMIDQQLRKESWARVNRYGGNKHWSWREYHPSGSSDIDTAKSVESPS